MELKILPSKDQSTQRMNSIRLRQSELEADDEEDIVEKINVTTAKVLANLTTIIQTTPMLPTTMVPITISTTPSPENECVRSELMWIKIALLGGILICLVILICGLCIASICYFGSLTQTAPNANLDIEQPPPAKRSVAIASTASIQPATTMDSQFMSANQQGSNLQAAQLGHFAPSEAQPANLISGFKRLTFRSDVPRAPLTSSLNSQNLSTFSANMAPPSPRSASTEMGMGSPEETVVKKAALDRMEQEEAKRHLDLVLMAEKSSSLAQLGEQMKVEAANAGVSTPSLPYKSVPLQKSDKKHSSDLKAQLTTTSNGKNSSKKKKHGKKRDKSSGSGQGSSGGGSGGGPGQMPSKNSSFTLPSL